MAPPMIPLATEVNIEKIIAQTGARGAPRNLWMVVVLAIVFGAICILPGIFMAFDSSPPSPPPPRIESEHGEDAWRIGSQFVQERLEPKPAKFPDPNDSKVCGWNLEADGWSVWGTVDTVNEFNGPVRRNWIAKVKFKGGDKWGLVFLNL